MGISRFPGVETPADWRTGLTLAGQGVLPTMGAVLLVPLAPQMIAEFSASAGASFQVMALMTVPGLCIALLSPLMGLWGDRFGKRHLLIAALLVYGLAGAAPVYVRPFGGLMVSRALLGVCEAAIMTLSAAMVVDLFDGERRGRWLANISLLASISGVVFAPLGGAIGASFGWRAVGLVYLGSLAFVPLMLRYTTAVEAKGSNRARGPADAGRFPVRHVAMVAAASLAGSTLLYGVVFNEGLAFSQLGVADPRKIGLILAIIGLCTPLGSMAFWAVGKAPVSVLLPCAFLLAGGSLALTLAVPGMAAFALGLGFALFGCGLILPTLLRWMMQDVPPHFRGRCSGVFQSMLAAGQFLGGMLVQGLAKGTDQRASGALGLLGAVALVATIVVLVVCRASGSGSGGGRRRSPSPAA